MITYLLGAGASFEVLPLGYQLGIAMEDLAVLLADYNDPNAKKLSSDLLWLSKKTNDFETVDSYAKQLHMHVINKKPGSGYSILEKQVDKSDEYKRLKNTLSAFFTISQHNKLDHRYNKLLSHLLNKERDFVFTLKDTVKILSWNYDSQLEIAYGWNYQRSATKTVHAMLASHPSPYSLGDKRDHPIGNFKIENYKMSVIHLNGVAGLYELHNSYEMVDIINSKSLAETITNALEVHETGRSYLNFAWDHQGMHTIDHAIKNTVDTEILVIIGYSLPIFNKEVDRNIFSSYSKLRKVYFQNTAYKPKEEIIQELRNRGINTQVEIAFEYNVSSFKIPDDID